MSVRKWKVKKRPKAKIKINREVLEDFLLEQIKDAWAEVVAELDLEFQAVIEDPNAFADQGFFDHDIVDTGRLRDSQVVTVENNSAHWTWDPISPNNGYHYASAVYHGFFAWGWAHRWIPGRHWPERAIQRLDPVGRLNQKLRDRGIPVTVARNNLDQLDV